VKRALIGGIGNVLLGDDGVGPYVIHLLESQYSFGDGVVVEDLGTPALDLTHRIVGLDLLILVDAVTGDEPTGSVVLLDKDAITCIAPAQRLDPHSPALSECLMAADMLGASPKHVLLIGVVGQDYEPGLPLSESVARAVPTALHAILAELDRHGFSWQKRAVPAETNIWWSDAPTAISQTIQ
jgi:hydrogenase maturation protease